MSMAAEMLPCPLCGVTVPASDYPAQKTHMETKHPEVITDRLERAGFRKDANGKWVDTLASAD